MLVAFVICATAGAVTFEEAWAAAEQRSVELGLLHERTVQIDTYRAQAWALVQPKLVLGATYTVNEYPIELDTSSFFDPASFPEEFQPFFADYEAPAPVEITPKRYFAWNASVIQPLFNGASLPLLRGAYRTIEAAHAEEASARGQVHAGLARVYYGVLVARAGVDVAAQALENAEAHRKLAEVQVSAGTAAPTATLQAQIAVARARREGMKARESASIAEQALAKLTGLAPDTAVEPPPEVKVPFGSVEEAVRHAGEHRPAIEAARLQAGAARMQRLATDLGWLPTVDGRLTWSYSENTGFTGDTTMWQVVLTANWTLWDGGFRIAEQRRTASMARMAGLAADRAALDAGESIHALWERHARATSALAAVEGEVSLATENLRLAEASYLAGSIPFIQLEDARLGLQAARVGVLAERMDRDLAVIDLLVATGWITP